MPVSMEDIHSADISPSLNGSLSLTNVTDLIQFLASSYKSGMIQLTKHPEKTDGKIFFASGTITSVSTNTLSGLEALSYILSWNQGEFQFSPDVTSIEKNIGFSVQHSIMEAAVLHDQRSNSNSGNKGTASKSSMSSDSALEERSTIMSAPERESTTVMGDLLLIPGIDAAVIVGRDGFVIESAGHSSRVNTDELGAALAHATNAIEEMGAELKVNVFQDLFIEYGKAVIMCKPVGDAIAAVIAPDASKLGIIRHKSKKYFEELALLF